MAFPSPQINTACHYSPSIFHYFLGSIIRGDQELEASKLPIFQKSRNLLASDAKPGKNYFLVTESILEFCWNWSRYKSQLSTPALALILAPVFQPSLPSLTSLYLCIVPLPLNNRIPSENIFSGVGTIENCLTDPYENYLPEPRENYMIEQRIQKMLLVLNTFEHTFCMLPESFQKILFSSIPISK